MKELLADSICADGLGFSTTGPVPTPTATASPWRRAGPTRPSFSSWPVWSANTKDDLEFASDGCLDGFDEEEIGFMTRFEGGRSTAQLNVRPSTPFPGYEPAKAMTASRRRSGRGLTMPVIVGMNMSFLNYCALNMMLDQPDPRASVPERIEKLRDLRPAGSWRNGRPLPMRMFARLTAGTSTSSATRTLRRTRD
jgi:hypothetical protein